MTLYLKVTPAFAKAVEQHDLKNEDYFRFNRLLDAFGSVAKKELPGNVGTWLIVDAPAVEAEIALKDKLRNDPAFTGFILTVMVAGQRWPGPQPD